MKYKVYQIHLTDAEVDKINAEGHDSVPKHKLKLDMSFNDDPGHLAGVGLGMGYYDHVANIEADDLEGVFHIGNMGPEEKIERLRDMHSLSVGDVVEDESGGRHVVAKFGFEKVD